MSDEPQEKDGWKYSWDFSGVSKIFTYKDAIFVDTPGIDAQSPSYRERLENGDCDE
jgi:hypothetical protein